MKKTKLLGRILRFTGSQIYYLIFALLFSVVNVTFSLYTTVLIGRAIDFAIEAGNVDFDSMAAVLVRIALIVGVGALAQWLTSLAMNKIAYTTVKNIRLRAFERLERVPIKYIDSHKHGDIMSRIITDVEHISDGLIMGFTQLFSGVVTIIGTLIFMLSINLTITAVVVVATPLSFVVASFVARNTFSMFRAQSDIRGEMTSLVEEMVGGQKVVVAFGKEEDNKEKFGEINRRLQKCSVKAIFFSSLTNPSTRFVNNLVYAGVAVLGAFLAMSGKLSVGQLQSFLSYANQYTKPFNEISSVLAELQSALACAERAFELIDEAEETPDAADAVELVSDGRVELENVAFSYDPDVSLIEDLNLSVEDGQRIAIVGPTGCGKTTVINLLMRFYDVDSGEIRVSSRPIKNVTRDSLRASYGMVLQESFLKKGTVFENIAYGKPDATREEVEAAAKAAYAHGFIKRLPDGYDTVIAEDGGNISQGQKQLLCIARIMLSLPPMLILDEATSSIDTRTEIKIQQAFSKMMEGRTSFIVAHRLSTIMEADCILVMEAGKITEKGRHAELVKNGGFYSTLYNSMLMD